MSRTRRSAKDAGTRWETACVDWLRAHGWNVERRARNGALDRGDIAGLPLVVECKDGARIDLAGWLAEAEREAVNAGQAVGVVWAHRRGKASPADGYVVMSGQAFAELLGYAFGAPNLPIVTEAAS